eukprot:scaffold111475_cov27-Tisochrysis_lutea.AAC.1
MPRSRPIPCVSRKARPPRSSHSSAKLSASSGVLASLDMLFNCSVSAMPCRIARFCNSRLAGSASAPSASETIRRRSSKMPRSRRCRWIRARTCSTGSSEPSAGIAVMKGLSFSSRLSASLPLSSRLFLYHPPTPPSLSFSPHTGCSAANPYR